MSFISYAQNLEDVMLWRALKHIDRGFYVDVGAAWPDEHSVTKAFYEKGWSGINIEPNPVHYSKLKEQRPRDINLNVAISDTSGSIEMSFIEDTGLSTLDLEIAKTHQAAGWGVKKELVDVKSLGQVWKEHIPQGQAVHFLKIDIEGLEEAAIRGNDWTNNRPWIVVVEATLPMSQVESHHTWEPMLVKAGYRFVYADGLNRFYIAKEHGELEEAFKYPPNVFDEYSLASQVDAEHRAAEAATNLHQAIQRADLAESHATQAWDQAQIIIGKAAHAIEQAGEAITQSITANERANHAEAQSARANERANHAEAQAAQANERANHAEAHANVINQQYLAVVHSRSWKLTKPLRLAGKFARWFVRGSIAWLTFKPGSRPRRMMRSAIISSMAVVQTRPRMKHYALMVLERFPRLKQRLGSMRFQNVPISPPIATPTIQPHEADLSPRARQIYLDLKKAIEKHNKECV